MSSVETFIEHIETNQFVDRDTLFIHSSYDVETLKKVANGLQHNSCPLGIHLSFTLDSPQHLRLFFDALTNPQCVQQLSFEFQLNAPSETIRYFTDAIKAQHFPKSFSMQLLGGKLTDNDIELLSNALLSENHADHLTITLQDNQMTENGVKTLALMLENEKCPKNLKLKINDIRQLTDKKAIELARALKSKNCPAVEIDLYKNQIKDGGFDALVESLASGQCAENLTLHLNGHLEGLPSILPEFMANRVTDPHGIKAVASALERGNCPRNLTINCRSLYLNDAEINALKTALTSGRCPEGLTLVFKLRMPGFSFDNKVNSSLIKMLAAVFSSSQCPGNLTIDLRHNFLRGEDFDLLTQAFISNKNIVNLKLYLPFFDDGAGTTVNAFNAFINFLSTPELPAGLTIAFDDLSPAHQSIIVAAKSKHVASIIITGCLEAEIIRECEKLHSMIASEEHVTDSPIPTDTSQPEGSAEIELEQILLPFGKLIEFQQVATELQYFRVSQKFYAFLNVLGDNQTKSLKHFGVEGNDYDLTVSSIMTLMKKIHDHLIAIPQSKRNRARICELTHRVAEIIELFSTSLPFNSREKEPLIDNKDVQQKYMALSYYLLILASKLSPDDKALARRQLDLGLTLLENLQDKPATIDTIITLRETYPSTDELINHPAYSKLYRLITKVIDIMDIEDDRFTATSASSALPQSTPPMQPNTPPQPNVFPVPNQCDLVSTRYQRNLNQGEEPKGSSNSARHKLAVGRDM